MNKAMLSADYLDAGANRVVAVLEELRSGIQHKLDMERTLGKFSTDQQSVNNSMHRESVYRAIVDDIALFIQREQRHGR